LAKWKKFAVDKGVRLQFHRLEQPTDCKGQFLVKIEFLHETIEFLFREMAAKAGNSMAAVRNSLKGDLRSTIHDNSGYKTLHNNQGLLNNFHI
jgi:hypothetical protein